MRCYVSYNLIFSKYEEPTEDYPSNIQIDKEIIWILGMIWELMS